MASIKVHIHNNTSSKLYAYATGRDLKNTLLALKADGSSIYYPTSPPNPLADVQEIIDIEINPKSQLAIQIPQMVGGRIWFSKDKPLIFSLNPGPAFVEPTLKNVDDPSNATQWGYCELTFDEKQLFANISLIDFVGLPIALQLRTQTGLKSVKGIPADGLKTIASELEKLGDGWEKLIQYSASGEVLRILGPNLGASLVPAFRTSYFDKYVDRVWGKYSSEDLMVDTQGPNGVVKGRVRDGKLSFEGIGEFEKPTARDIFTCDSGPFATFADGVAVSKDKLNVGARISAALNRSTLWSNANQPQGEKVESYYKEAKTNHYARICHEVTSDHLGYAFPYDDVHSSADGTNQEGAVNDDKPRFLQIFVGGEN
jgi:hypothetical protein